MTGRAIIGRLAIVVTVGSILAAAAFGHAAAGAKSPGECYTRAVNWTGTIGVRAPKRLLVRAEIRSVRICGREWSASATITNTWTKPLWWSHRLWLQPRHASKHPQAQLLRRSDASEFRPAPPRVLQPQQRWVGTFGATSLPLAGDQLRFGVALFSSDALRCNCPGFGITSPWFARRR